MGLGANKIELSFRKYFFIKGFSGDIIFKCLEVTKMMKEVEELGFC